MNEKYLIRFNTPRLLEFCEAHDIYEEANYEKSEKAEKLENDLFGKFSKFFCLVVESDSELEQLLNRKGSFS